MTDDHRFKVLLPRTRHALERNGVDSAEKIKAIYPVGLLRLRGFGWSALRDVESAFFPGEKYEPTSYRRVGRPLKTANEDFLRSLFLQNTSIYR
ncbi:hypothetical protein D3C71_1721880 [compost metagenome]